MGSSTTGPFRHAGQDGDPPTAGPADVLFGHLPGLDRDVRRPPAEAGYAPRLIAPLGEGLG